MLKNPKYEKKSKLEKENIKIFPYKYVNHLCRAKISFCQMPSIANLKI